MSEEEKPAPVDMNAVLRRGGSLTHLNDAWARRLLGADPDPPTETDDTDADADADADADTDADGDTTA